MKFHIQFYIVALSMLFSAAIQSDNHTTSYDRKKLAYDIRMKAAKKQILDRESINFKKHQNGDEKKVPDFAACFTKLFEHDPITGVLTSEGKKNYKKLLHALKSGKQKDFNDLSFAAGATSKLVNPQNAFTFSLTGSDATLFACPKPPKISSKWAAAEIIELYLQAICRNVAYEDYGTGQESDNDGFGGSITIKAAEILNAFGNYYKGPRDAYENVTPSVLFRGKEAHAAVGPYISQFLLFPVHKVFQPLLPQNQYIPIAKNREFGVAWNDFIAIQNGRIPQPYDAHDFAPDVRYPINGRDLGTFVHLDGPYDAYFNAVNILLYNKFPFSPALPYYNGDITREAAFNSLGGPNVFELMAAAAENALNAVWFQKWSVARRLRPEAFAGLVQTTKVTGNNRYNLNSWIFNPPSGDDVLAMVLEYNQRQANLCYNSLPLEDASTYLLSQMYPDGSPNHPSYLSGHATIAGACVTIIKAFIDDTQLIINRIAPVKPNPENPTELVPLNGEGEDQMTVGSELDKYASNIAFGRNFAGIHWRSDADYGIELGEQVAIQILQNYARTYTEDNFKAFELTKRNGQRIRITKKSIKNI